MKQTQSAVRRASLATLISITAVVSGCGSDSDSTSAPAQSAEFFGIWERSGYGDVLKISSDGGVLYQFTRNGCLQAEELNNNELSDFISAPELSDDGSSLLAFSAESEAFEIRLDRLSALPDACVSQNLIAEETPIVTFEHLWHSFNDYYAFFEERGVDWQNQYDLLRPEVNDELSDDELLEIVAQLLEPLNDGHVMLNTGFSDFNFSDETGFNRLLIDTFDETRFDSIQDYADDIAPRFVNIRSSYLDSGSQNNAGGNSGQRVSWGTINQRLGFLRIARMQDLTSNGDESVSANVDAINQILQSAFTDLQDTTALIIDVRTNGGGEDAVSLAIAGHFTDDTRLAVSKTARSFQGETESLEALISPANDSPYLNPVVVIGASDTSSAAEIFLMAMSTLPHVTLLGENSHGILSDILSKSLPNGWEVGLSNEVYKDSLGQSFEAIGVPVDIEATPYSLDAIAQERDFAIEAAMEALGF